MARTGRGRGVDLRSLVPLAVVALVAVVGLALLSSAFGWFTPAERSRPSAPPGTLAIPVAGSRIPTYTRVRLEHLVDPSSGDLRAIYLPEGSVLPETFVDAREIVGRVVAVDKQPGQVFSSSDFFPEGTREGIVAGIPSGKRALRIDARKVSGIVGLARGDLFDLIATIDMSQGAGRGFEIKQGAMQGVGRLGSSIQATTIVERGAVVQPLETRVVPGRVAEVVEEMVIAVEPGEAALLTEALHRGARIDCVPLSGRPASAAEDGNDVGRTPGGYSLKMVETIAGGERRVIAVGAGDRVAPPLPQVSAGPRLYDSSGRGAR